MRVSGIPFVQGRNDYRDADGRKYGIAIHNTSNDATDVGEASYASRRTDGISAHFYVDNDSITQSLDTEDCAGHAGSWQGNGNSIAVEITGANAWTRRQWIDRVAWDKLAKTLAAVIRHHWGTDFPVRRVTTSEMRTNPKAKGFYGHNDMRLAWGQTTHTDPGPNFPWDHLLDTVKNALNPPADPAPTPEVDMQLTDTVYTDGNGKTRTVGSILGSLDVIVRRTEQTQALVLQTVKAVAADDDNDVELTPEQVELLTARVTAALQGAIPSPESIADAVNDDAATRLQG